MGAVAPAESAGRHEVVCSHDAADEVVPVVLHSGQSHVACGGAPWSVEPDSHVRQLGSLVLVDGASIADPQREVDDAADGNVVVRVAVDGEQPSYILKRPRASCICARPGPPGNRATSLNGPELSAVGQGEAIPGNQATSLNGLQLACSY